MSGTRAAWMDAARIAALFALLSVALIAGTNWVLAWFGADVEHLAGVIRYRDILYTLLLSALAGGLIYTRARRQQVLDDALQSVRTDVVTGLPTQAVALAELDERLANISESEGQVGIVLFDVQGMARINQGMGRSAGDKLLRATARRLWENMPRRGLLARVEGNKFLLVAGNNRPVTDALARRAQVMVRQASLPLVIDGVELSVRLRAVVASGPAHGRDAMSLLDAADTALSSARQKRLRGVSLIGEVDPAPAVHLELEADLRRALQQSALDVHFQPQYNVHTRDLVGAEVLVRWHHPSRGPITPSEFIPLAESCGLIDQVTDFVLSRVCGLITAWRRAGKGVPRMAVNISGLELTDRKVVERVRSALRTHPGCAEYLELEITETRIMENAALSRQVLGSLQAMGVNVAIDDFGTGYSSLSYLTQFPIDCLKIDRAFVSKAHLSMDKRAVLAAIATLGNSLGLRVLAEGVETADELRVVIDCGVSEAQGYYFARPMPADAFLAECLRTSAAPEWNRG